MSKPARRKDMRRLAGTLEHVADAMGANVSALDRIQDTLADHGIVLTRLERDLKQEPVDMERLERLLALLNGVKVMLERMGGNTLPSVLTDILALRDQMGEFRRELSDYRGALMRLTKWIDDDVLRPYEERVGPEKEWFKPKRKYNRRKKAVVEDQPQIEKSEDDAALHTDQSEVENSA